MRFKRVLIGTGLFYASCKLAAKALIVKDAKMSLEERCQLYGLKCEKYFIETEDDYILQVHRVYDAKEKVDGKPAVMMQHGFMDSSINWMSNAEKSPALLLAKEGYDVWMNNSRGNKYSRFHKYLNPDSDKEYWDFTFQDMGLKDSKACIKFIKNTTNQQKVPYIGCSQGSAQMVYGLAKDNDWYKDNMSIFIALCPVARPSENASKYLRKLAHSELFKKLLLKSGLNELPTNSLWLQSLYCCLVKLVPQYGRFYQSVTSDLKPEVNNDTSFQCFWYNLPSGTSVKNFLHWGSIMKYSSFVELDHDPATNTKLYGQEKPPPVDLSKIQDVPVALLCAEYDFFSPLEDSRWMRDNIKHIFYKEYSEYGHLTFLIGKDMCYIDDVLKLLKEHQTS